MNAAPNTIVPVGSRVSPGALRGSRGAGVLPTGSIVAFAGATAPEGWLVANGAVVSRTEFPDLFAVIGTTYGAPGELTFNLPDLRSRCPVGLGPLDGSGTHNFTLGLKYGADQVTLTTAQIPSHGHVVDINHNHGVALNAHNHGDPSHAHLTNVDHYHNITVNDHNHGDPSHGHTNNGAYVQYQGLSVGAGGNATYGLGGPGPTHWTNYAGVGLHNAGAIGGSTWWTSQMDGSWANRASDYRTVGLQNAGNFGGSTNYVSEQLAGWHNRDTTATGGGGAHNNVPPSLGLNYIIKY